MSVLLPLAAAGYDFEQDGIHFTVGGDSATVTAIGKNAFADCISLAGITIPASVRAIGLKAFYGCTALHDIYMQVDDPQLVTVGKSAFDLEAEDYTGRTLHVPAGTAAAYQQSSPWQSRFEIICEQ